MAKIPRWVLIFACAAAASVSLTAQLIDRTRAINTANEGIGRSLADQVGPGRGNANMVDSSAFIIARDPFRSIRRGRQLFQRKFPLSLVGGPQGVGPIHGDGAGNPDNDRIIGAGLSDSCAGCHGRPRGSAGFGGDVVTRPDSRDAPHLFGLGLKEMLADEITADLRDIRENAIEFATRRRQTVRASLVSKGIRFGSITVSRNGNVDTSDVDGVDADLRVRPFFHHGGTISLREFIVGALNAEMGLQVADEELREATDPNPNRRRRIVTPSGMVLDPRLDAIEAPPTGPGELDRAVVDHLEFYLLNYFKAGTGERTFDSEEGRRLMDRVGCTSCHIPTLTIQRDRRVADVETVFDPVRGNMNRLFATATPLFTARNDGSGHPTLKVPNGNSFVVRNIYTDFKRHDLGPNFHEREYNGTIQRQFLTTPLWGVGSTGPYGHDGRSITLMEVILRHGGEAARERREFEELSRREQNQIIDFLNTLILFPPDDTASNLDPGDRNAAGFPQFGHGSIRLAVLFNNPLIVE